MNVLQKCMWLHVKSIVGLLALCVYSPNTSYPKCMTAYMICKEEHEALTTVCKNNQSCVFLCALCIGQNRQAVFAPGKCIMFYNKTMT